MKIFIHTLVIIILTSCNGGRIPYEAEKYGPPQNLTVTQNGNEKIEKLFWTHGRIASKKVFTKETLKRHIIYLPYKDQTSISSITYYEGDQKLVYKDAGFWIIKTLYEKNQKAFHYEFKKDYSKLAELKNISLTKEEFEKYSYSEKDPHFQVNQ
ncbi:MAG: hypothetical protein ABGY95_11405 [Rubritalea sp.]|uniref:hypothetical protein n=1 Tax=Rubritalea sp. TaxID=2109375 RepID=UPI0032428627